MVANTDERIFFADLEGCGIPAPEKEIAFASPIRKWKADYAFPEISLIVEIEGGVYTNGRHITPMGFQEDMFKYNAAAVMGWSIMRFTPTQMRNGIAVRWIKFYFEHNGARKIRRAGELSEGARRTISECSNEIRRSRRRQEANRSKKKRRIKRFKIR